MAKEIIVPEMGESITEATILSWSFQEGDSVKADDILAELETDKVTMEVPAPASGVLSKIQKKAGETVSVKEVIGLIDESGTLSPKKEEISEISKKEDLAYTSDTKTNDTLPPSVRKLMEENHIKSNDIKGSGKNGQITKEDVLEYLEKQKKQSKSSEESSKPSSVSPSILEKIQSLSAKTPVKAEEKAMQITERETIEPMSKLRQTIANRLLSAQQNAAILTTFNEVDMSGVMNLRAKYKDSFKETHNVGLGFMSFFTRASIAALKKFPLINAEIRGNSIVHKHYYDIGVAVEVERISCSDYSRRGSIKLCGYRTGNFTFS